jgi:hypothetical protein
MGVSHAFPPFAAETAASTGVLLQPQVDIWRRVGAGGAGQLHTDLQSASELIEQEI